MTVISIFCCDKHRIESNRHETPRRYPGKNSCYGLLSCTTQFCKFQIWSALIVLTFCRMLQTLYTGTMQSKRAGSRWAEQFLDPKSIKLIEQAWNEREGVRFMVKIHQRAEQILLDGTLEFINYADSQIDNVKG